MITVEQIDQWLLIDAEHEGLEFKAAKSTYDKGKLFQYINAIANEGGGHILLGVSDKKPRKVTDSKAFPNASDRQKICKQALGKMGIRVDCEIVEHPSGRVLVFIVPSRPQGQPIALDGAYWMRSGESLEVMTPDRLKRIFDEGEKDWLSQVAKKSLAPDEVVSLLDTQGFFDLLKENYPSNREKVLKRLSDFDLVSKKPSGWTIYNLGAILLAKKLDAFTDELASKAPRFIHYDGKGKLKTRNEIDGVKGYAVGFDGLIDFIHSSAPQNSYIEEAVREEVKMFPRQAIRELVANALVHQDFSMKGASIRIEMYDDRLEMSNLGLPPIKLERFIDEDRAKNEKLSELMRRFGVCERKGSGVDKVVDAAELFQLPAPDFLRSDLRTTAILYAHKDFEEMTRKDRVRACYQHCCLKFVMRDRMSNQSLRERFGLPESKSNTASAIIKETKDKNLIKPDESESTSTRYARYLPHWA